MTAIKKAETRAIENGYTQAPARIAGTKWLLNRMDACVCRAKLLCSEHRGQPARLIDCALGVEFTGLERAPNQVHLHARSFQRRQQRA